MAFSPWPADDEHCDAIETILCMVDAEERWGEHDRALALVRELDSLGEHCQPEHDWRCEVSEPNVSECRMAPILMCSS